MDHGVGGGQVQPGAAGLEADQEHGTSAALERVDRRLAIARLRRSASTWRIAAREQLRLISASMRANCENTSMRRPSATASAPARAARRAWRAPSHGAARAGS